MTKFNNGFDSFSFCHSSKIDEVTDDENDDDDDDDVWTDESASSEA